jgi:hypothetical protein
MTKTETTTADAFVRTRDGEPTWLCARDVLHALERLPAGEGVPFLLHGFHPVAALQTTDRGVYLWDACEVEDLDRGLVSGNLDGLRRNPTKQDVVDALRAAPEWATVYVAFSGGVDTVRMRERDAEDGGGPCVSFESDGSTWGCASVVDLAGILPELDAPPLPEMATVDKARYDALLRAVDAHAAAVAAMGKPPLPTWDAVLEARMALLGIEAADSKEG